MPIWARLRTTWTLLRGWGGPPMAHKPNSIPPSRKKENHISKTYLYSLPSLLCQLYNQSIHCPASLMYYYVYNTLDWSNLSKRPCLTFLSIEVPTSLKLKVNKWLGERITSLQHRSLEFICGKRGYGCGWIGCARIRTGENARKRYLPANITPFCFAVNSPEGKATSAGDWFPPLNKHNLL